jgi:protein TonB
MAVASILVVVATAMSSAQQVYSAKDAGVTLPVAIEQARVEYTQDAWDKGIEGIVTLDCDVMADGSVGAVLVTGSLDKTYGLDEQAVKAVTRWKFRPGTRDGKVVPVRVDVTVKFTLARSPRPR